MTDFPISRRWLVRGASGLAAVGPSWLSAALAQGAGSGGRLRVGLAAPNTTLDPHFQSNAPNNAVTSHILDALVTNDETSQSKPGLAESWRVLDDTHWELKLRRGVTFTNGQPFTAADAIASLQRPSKIPNSPASFLTYTRSIKSMTAPDPHTLVLETAGADPLLLNSISRIRVISERFKDAETSAFNNGQAMIGTGAFILKEYVPASRVVLTRNPNWWGGELPWNEVVLSFATDDGGRLASLLSGDLDLIESLPSASAERVRTNNRFQLIRGISSRFVHFNMDQHRDVTPNISGKDGRPLTVNPLKDVRVRRALSMAINRQALQERVMEGDAVIASQFLRNGSPGTSPEIDLTPFDVNGARALLAEAGFPNGFRMTVHGPNDRINNDAKIVQAVAQMLTRIGIEAQADVMPWSVYSMRGPRGDFSFSLASWGVNTGETSNPLKALVATYDARAGMGASNSGRYSNAEVDRKLEQALRTLDDTARNALLGEICTTVFREVAVIPLHHEVSVWAARRGVDYATRADQYTLAMGVRRS